MRFEYKFLVKPAEAECILRECREKGQRDPHCGKEGYYSIESIYKITANADEQTYKLRLRKYDNGEQEDFFVEEKIAGLGGAIKNRVRVTPNEYKALSKESDYWILKRRLENQGIELSVFQDERECQLKTIPVCYRRIPFIQQIGDVQYRLTLDSDLKTLVAGKEIPFFPDGTVVFEVKGEGSPVELFREYRTIQPMEVQKFSKYKQAQKIIRENVRR